MGPQIHQESPAVVLRETHIQDAISTSISKTQNLLLEQAQTKETHVQEYGTTAIIGVLWSGQNLTVANVGDSRAILIRKQNNEFRCIEMSEDHSLNRKEERNRIFLKKGKIVGQIKNRRVIPSVNDYSQEDISKHKLALNMSRSLGHLILSNYGVSSTPDMKTIIIEDGDYLVLASDGLWDVMKHEEIRNIIENSEDSSPQEIADNLISLVKEKNEEIQNSDNTTIVVTKFTKTCEVVLNLSEVLPQDITPTTSWRTSTDSGATTNSSPLLVSSGTLQRMDTPVLDYSESTGKYVF